jgi:hypothetical protein
MPCVPAPAGIWLGAMLPLIGGVPGLNSTCMLMCSFGGSISIVSPGQSAVLYS